MDILNYNNKAVVPTISHFVKWLINIFDSNLWLFFKKHTRQKGNLVQAEENYSAGMLKIPVIHWLSNISNFFLEKGYGCLARQLK